MVCCVLPLVLFINAVDGLAGAEPAVFATTGLLSSIGSADPSERRPVLILNSYRRGTRYTELQESAIYKVLKSKPGIRTRIFRDYLDLPEGREAEFFSAYAQILRHRYHRTGFDLIVTTDTPAFRFMLEQGEEIFPGVPVVFSGLTQFELLEQLAGRSFTGVMEAVDVSATLELIQTVQPHVTQVHLIADDSKLSRRLVEAAREAIGKDDAESGMQAAIVNYVWHEDTEIPELLNRVATLPPDSAILFLTDFGPEGVALNAQDTTMWRVVHAASVPAYGLYDAHLSLELLGGVFISAEAQGRAAGDLALRILKGERAGSIPVITRSPNVAMFNWNAMRRWGIRESDLPSGSEIHYREATLLERHFWKIVAGTLASVFLVAMVSALIANHVHRRRAEKKLSARQVLLREIISSVPHAIFWKDENSVYQGCNIQFARAVGLESPDDVVGRTDFDLHTDREFAERYRATDREVLANPGAPLQFEEPNRRKDGTLQTVLGSKIALCDASGRVNGVLGVFTDITSMKEEERRLRERDARLELLTEIATSITSNLPVEEIITRTVHRVAAAFPYLRISYSTVDEGRRLRIVTSSQPAGWPSIEGMTLDLSDASAYLDILRSGRPVKVRDMLSEPSEVPCRLPIDANVTRAFFDVPVRHTRGLVGVLCMCTHSPHNWTEFETTTLESIAGYLSVAIQESVARSEAMTALASLNESEARFLAFMDNCPSVAFLKHADGRYVYANPTLEGLSGKSTREMEGKLDSELWPPASAAQFREHDLIVLRSGKPEIMEETLHTPDGPRSYISYKFPFRDAAGREYVGGMAVEITALRAAERALRESEQLLRQVVDSIDNLFWMSSPDKQEVYYVSPQYERIVGRSREDLYQRPLDWLEAIIPEDRERIIHKLPTQRDGSYEQEYRIRRPDGTIRWIRDRAFPIKNEEGEVTRIAGIAEDITERKAAEDAARKLLAFRESIIHTVAEGICVHYPIPEAPYQRFTVWNDRMCEITGYTKEEINRLGWLQAVYPDPDVRSKAHARMFGTHEGRHLRSEEWTITRRDGAERIVEISTSAVETDEGIAATMAVMHDVTMRIRAERAIEEARKNLERRVQERTAELSESEERFQKLSDAAFEGIVIHENGRIIAANRALADMFGYDLNDLVGMTRTELIAPVSEASAVHRGQRVSSLLDEDVREGVGTRRNGSVFPIELRGRWVPYQGRLVNVTAVRDMSEQRRAEEEKERHQAALAHALRQITLGELASGLAHELNQPLAAIASYIGAAMRRLDEKTDLPPEALEEINLAAEQGERASQIIRRMRQFARKSETNVTPVSINAIIVNALKLVEADIMDSGVQLVSRLKDGLPLVDADAIQIEQVVINLVRNSCDALRTASRNDGRIEVSTDWTDDRIKVVVSDNGPGLESQIADRLFDAFSTTKSGGLGLGLSISRGIIESHGGRIGYIQPPNGGAEFEIELPVSKTARVGSF